MKRAQTQTMAEILAALPATPPPDSEPDAWGTEIQDGVLHAPDGRAFTQVRESVASSTALTLLRDGALVAWDGCGCGGFCGFDWLGAERRAALLTAGAPRIGGRAAKRRWGVVSHWRADDGTDLLLAEHWVRWGTELA